MADPISLVSLVAIVLHSSKLLYQLIEKVKGAPRDARETFEDSMIVRNYLLQLKENLDDDKDVVLGPENALRTSLENTNVTLKNLEETIKPFVQTKNSTWMGFEWALKQKEVNELRKKLKDSQAALATALAISVKNETKLISGHTQAIMDTQNLTLENLTTFGNKLVDHSNSITDTQTIILDTVKQFENKLDLRSTNQERENVWHNPTDLIGLSNYLESVAVARYSPPPTNAAGMSTFDEDLDDDTVPLELSIDPHPASTRLDLESEIEGLLLKQHSENCLMNDEGQTALHLAAQQDVYLTQRVLSHGLHPDEPNVEGETPLMSAIMAENIDTAKVLLKQGADVNASNENAETPLHYAARHNRNDSMTQLLLRRKADIEAVDNSGMTALYISALQGNDIVCRCLIEAGANVYALEPDGWTALHYLAMRGDPTCMEPLLSDAGADVEVFYNPNHFGSQSSIAYDTSSKRKVALVKPLLDKGADINAKSRGFTALNLAVLSCQDLLVTTFLAHNASAQGTRLVCLNWGLSTENLEQLLKGGAMLEARDSRHRKTALIWAAETGSLAAIKVLLDCGADVNAQDDQKLSALRYAAANARTEIVQLLLERGADPEMGDRGGKTPLIAVAWGRPFSLGGRFYNPSPIDRERTASLLIDAGAKSSAKDVWGTTALHYAAQNGYLELLKLLHCKGNCNLTTTCDGKSALDLATERGHTSVAKYLKRHMVLDRGKNQESRPGNKLEMHSI
ncbi:MAG: hypothetical protein Q9195_008554 [Heterodermia aff. obscurata]